MNHLFELWTYSHGFYLTIFLMMFLYCTSQVLSYITVSSPDESPLNPALPTYGECWDHRFKMETGEDVPDRLKGGT